MINSESILSQYSKIILAISVSFLLNHIYPAQGDSPLNKSQVRIEYFDNGTVRQIETYQNGLKDGWTYEFLPDGFLVRRSQFSEGQLHGKSETFYNDSSAFTESSTFYHLGEIKWKREYYPNGAIAYDVVYSSPGNCAYTKYAIDGQIVKGNIVNGQKDGIERSYMPDGTLNYEKKYKDGIIIE